MRYDPVDGAMPDSWAVTTIGDACDQHGGEVQTGPFGSQLHASDYVTAGIPSIMPQDIKGDRVSTEAVAKVRPADAERLSRHRVQVGDIVYSRRGDVERRALITERETGWLCGTGCLRVRLRHPHIDDRYFYYYLGHPSVRAYIVRHAHGATMPNLNTGILRAVPLCVPSHAEQRRIAAVLGALDDKIELNRQMSLTLEEMAQAIFKSWFIDFDGHEPADMVDSELGLSPRGWRVSNLSVVADNVREVAQPGDVDGETPYVGLEHVPRRSASLDAWGRAAEADSAKGRFEKGDILFGKLRPYFHKVVPAPVSGVASTDIIVVRPKQARWRWFTFGHLFNDEMVAHATASSDGTKMPRTKWADLCRYTIAVPPTDVVEEFDRAASPLFGRLWANSEHSRTLASLRDTLLPKLISGEIRVPEAEAAVAQATA